MSFRIGLAQTCHPADGDAASLVGRYAAQAADEGVDLLVFPESLMSRYELEKGAFLAQSQEIGGYFSRTVEGIAAHYGLWIVYTMNEKNPAGPDALPFNTAVLVDAVGIRRGCYRKVHLFDTDFTRESERMSAGDSLFEPVSTPFGRIGLGICYDLRFPELARAQAHAGCDVMIYPSAWVDGPGKADQWKVLLAARAVENQMFAVGVSRADEGYIGTSCVYSPAGSALACADGTEQLLVCDIDTSGLEDARCAMPILDHRRRDLY